MTLVYSLSPTQLCLYIIFLSFRTYVPDFVSSPWNSFCRRSKVGRDVNRRTEVRIRYILFRQYSVTRVRFGDCDTKVFDSTERTTCCTRTRGGWWNPVPRLTWYLAYRNRTSAYHIVTSLFVVNGRFRHTWQFTHPPSLSSSPVPEVSYRVYTLDVCKESVDLDFVWENDPHQAHSTVGQGEY